MDTQTREARQEAFEQDVCDYLAYLAGVRNLSENTVRAYQTDLDAYCAYLRLEGKRGDDMGHRDLRRYLAYLRRSGYTNTTIGRHLSSIRGLYKWLVGQERLSSDAAAALASPKLSKTLPRTMSDADVRLVLETCDPSTTEGLRDGALIELMYATGARISEVSRLDVGDIDFGQAQVRLFGKGSKERVVPLYGHALDVVRRYMAEARPLLAARRKVPDNERTRALFVSTRGNRMSADALRSCFERHIKLAGIEADVTPHAMRHTYATELLSGGADLRSVQELLGHESLATTQIYTHLSVERLKEATRQAHPRGE